MVMKCTREPGSSINVRQLNNQVSVKRFFFQFIHTITNGKRWESSLVQSRIVVWPYVNRSTPAFQIPSALMRNTRSESLHSKINTNLLTCITSLYIAQALMKIYTCHVSLSLCILVRRHICKLLAAYLYRCIASNTPLVI